ncbi:hypothetical protein KGM_211430 [Danaus plexippus plexippus]|uniref:Uncharacterized protein n=1 Tax=Danaus plexippus plexippus TaxID=278856 RepID=A0A212F5R3_DANPL|nr:hypothetical protein KGM_211430 [Danaus plexippus plexippus]
MDGPSAKKSTSFETLVIQNISNTNDLKAKLNEIIASGKDYEYDVSSCIKALLNNNDPVIVLLTVQALSELAKCETKRDTYAQKDVIVPILSILSKDVTLDNVELIKHCCRALGNLCCDCDTSRNILLQNNGVCILGNVLKICIENNTSTPLGEIKVVVVKALLNYAIGGQEYSESLVKSDLIEYSRKMLTVESFKEVMDDDLVSTILTLLTVINDNNTELLFDVDLNMAVLNVLRETTNVDVSELALEHLHTQAEHESVKTLLAKEGGVNLVCSRLELLLEHQSTLTQDSEVEAVMKQACDLIIIVLTGDEAMHILYNNGKGEVYQSVVRWLESSHHQLLVTAVLAVGNFARQDNYCEKMMNEHIFDKLLAIFEHYHSLGVKMQSSEEVSVSPMVVMKLQHASLSAIRNLCVPMVNKRRAAAGPAPAVFLAALPHVQEHNVAYKLLAAIRMLLDGQESVAREVACSPWLHHISSWGGSGHAGAGAESPRLLARVARLLPQNLLPRLLEADCVSRLVDMLLASHALMQNEALVALTLLAAGCQPDTNLTDQLVKSEIGKHLSVLVDTNCAKMPLEVAENLLSFLEVTSRYETLLLDYKSAKVHDALTKFATSRDDLDHVDNRIHKIIDLISEEKSE